VDKRDRFLKRRKPAEQAADLDTMRREHDFPSAKRGATAARYEQGTNIAVIAPDVLDLFPDSESVKEALRALVPIVRQQRRRKMKLDVQHFWLKAVDLVYITSASPEGA